MDNYTYKWLFFRKPKFNIFVFSNSVISNPMNQQIQIMFFSVSRRYWTVERPRQPLTYQVLKRLCRERGELFEDVDFPPSPKSLFPNKKLPMQPIVWMRPHVSNIHFCSTCAVNVEGGGSNKIRALRLSSQSSIFSLLWCACIININFFFNIQKLKKKHKLLVTSL